MGMRSSLLLCMAGWCLIASVSVVAEIAESTVPSVAAEPQRERSRAEMESIISTAGRKPPVWWAATPLNYPDTLRLDWPEPQTGEKWQPQRNPDQYLIGVINPNPRQWRGGAKLFHHMLTVNRVRPAVLVRVMDRIGHIYANLLGDYARGAFWYRAAAKTGTATREREIGLARCYWKLGSCSMAVDMLSRVQRGDSSVVHLWAEMGDLARALEVADSSAQGRSAPLVYLAAGNVCRAEGDYTRALDYYGKVVQGTFRGSAKEIEGCRSHARSAIEAVRVVEALDLDKLRDGTYRGIALGYRGNVEVEVAIQTRRIAAVSVTRHREDWFFSSLTEVPRQIIANQGLKGVDAVTGATITSMAIVSAAGEALGKALP